MPPIGRERRGEHSKAEEISGVVRRSAREGVPITELPLRPGHTDVDTLRASAQKKFLH